MRYLFILICLGLFACESSTQIQKETPKAQEWAIVLHGGAGTPKFLNQEEEQSYHAALAEALQIGKDILAEGGSSADAVEQTIRYLEDSPLFNAGKGAVINAQGVHELDAAFMDGSTMGVGALTGLTTVKNPISLARKVMADSKHVFFGGAGAEQFADEMGVERVDNSYFTTEKRKAAWEKMKAKQDSALAYQADDIVGHSLGTVGCVALDRQGRIVAGTSTGGMTMKHSGRIGDAPVIGAGTYANTLVGVSATGSGEEFIRRQVAYDVAALMEYAGLSLEEACYQVIQVKMPKDMGGIIALDRWGNIQMPFNTPGMFRAAADASGRFETGIYQ